MKRIVILIIFLMTIIGCVEETKTTVEETSPAGKFFEGQHELKALSDEHYLSFRTDVNTNVRFVTFMWHNTNTKNILMTELPIDKIRYKDENYGSPYVKFRWGGGIEYFKEPKYLENIIYAQIHIDVDDFDWISTDNARDRNEEEEEEIE